MPYPSLKDDFLEQGPLPSHDEKIMPNRIAGTAKETIKILSISLFIVFPCEFIINFLFYKSTQDFNQINFLFLQSKTSKNRILRATKHLFFLRKDYKLACSRSGYSY